MNKSEFLNKPWFLHPTFNDMVMAEGINDFSFQAGDNFIAQRVVEDHNKLLTIETNQEGLDLLLESLDKIEKLKGEANSQVDNFHILESFIRLELPKYLAAKINKDHDLPPWAK